VSGRDPYLAELAEHGFRQEDADRFLAVWDRLEAAYFERMYEVAAPFEEWRDRFRAAATETVNLVEAYPAEARFMIVDVLFASGIGRERQRAFSARIVELIDSARAELEDPDAVPEATASWIAGVFFDRIYRRCGSAAGPDLHSQLPELLFLTISAYFGTEVGLRELLPPA
jgi:AcrR family transcriptional regulator